MEEKEFGLPVKSDFREPCIASIAVEKEEMRQSLSINKCIMA